MIYVRARLFIHDSCWVQGKIPEINSIPLFADQSCSKSQAKRMCQHQPTLCTTLRIPFFNTSSWTKYPKSSRFLQSQKVEFGVFFRCGASLFVFFVRWYNMPSPSRGMQLFAAATPLQESGRIENFTIIITWR